jgi:hypothetical protein
MEDLPGIAKRFYSLFLGLDRVYGKFTIGQANPDKAGKLEGEAATIVGQLSPTLWEKHLTGKQGLGIVPITDAGTCLWGAIDIDIYDGFDHKALEKQISKLPLVLCRTKSGGAHLYLFCKEPISAEVVRGKLLDLAMQLGFNKVEVFPKQTKLYSKKDPGSWINMPYFDCEGSNLRPGIFEGKALTPEQFLTFAENKRVAKADLDQATVEGISDDFADGPPCLQMLARDGIPEGGRNNGLYDFGVYAKMKHPDNWEEILEEYNHSYVDPPLKMADLKLLIKSLKKKVYYYQCNQPPIQALCNKEVCKGRQFGVGGDEPDVEYTCLIKIASSPPTWILEVNKARLELSTVDLLQQQKVRLKCMDALNILPKSISPAKYEKIIKGLLEAVEVVEAPPDAGPEGRLWDLIERFMIERAGGKSIEDLLRGLPWTENNLTKFRSQDLMKYLDTQHFRDLNERQIWAIFRRDEKVKHGQTNVKGTLVRWWAIPEIKQQDSDFKIPKQKEEM